MLESQTKDRSDGVPQNILCHALLERQTARFCVQYVRNPVIVEVFVDDGTRAELPDRFQLLSSGKGHRV